MSSQQVPRAVDESLVTRCAALRAVPALAPVATEEAR